MMRITTRLALATAAAMVVLGTVGGVAAAGEPSTPDDKIWAEQEVTSDNRDW